MLITLMGSFAVFGTVEATFMIEPLSGAETQSTKSPNLGTHNICVGF